MTRRELIEERIAPWSSTAEKRDLPWGILSYSTVTLKHCFRGNPGTGVLWTVHETTVVWGRTWPVPSTVTTVERWIGCDLLQYRSREWGYKPMDESMGPFYWSCPLGYLDITPTANHTWRQNVRYRHRLRKLHRKHKGAA